MTNKEFDTTRFGGPTFVQTYDGELYRIHKVNFDDRSFMCEARDSSLFRIPHTDVKHLIAAAVAEQSV